MSDLEILENLNPAQKEAVTWANTPLLILAGAGSGKTRILTRRIAYLIAQGARPFQILGVTFTNKAAGEMKHRVQQMVQQDVWVSTFHSTCMRILRMDGPAIGIDKSFTVYDDSDQLTLIKECLKELSMNEKQIHPKAVRERISRSKDLLMTPYQYAENAPDLFEDAVGKVYKRYEEKLEKLQGLDFGDLIAKTVRLFDQKPAVLQTWQDRFQHILIDEYQDTNHAQYRLIKLLAAARKQLTVVGDPDQSIYAWRGADIRNILSFEKDYPECGIIRMEQNYRSTQVILDAANELIKRNQIRRPKDLWTDREGGEHITLNECLDEKHEAEYVVKKVLENKRGGKKLAEQVVFYRVHAQSRVIEDALRKANVPYKIVGGTRFYDRKEIKDLIAYLRVLINPNDDVSLKRIVNVPARGIGKKAVEVLEHALATQGFNNLDEVLANLDSVEGLTPRALKSLTSFYYLIVSLRKEVENLSVSELLEQILGRTRYVEILQEEKTVESQSRIENIEEFFSVIEDFQEHYSPAENTGDTPPLTAFLESITLMTDLDKMEDGTNVLTLMSLHTAKGLEFPIVYMVGLEEGIFPSGKSYNEDPEDMEEERRLCYVGMTRAMDKLHMTYARQRRLYGAQHHNLPSRFLNEIPNALFETRATGESLHEDLAFEDIFDDSCTDDDIMIDLDEDDDRKNRILFDFPD